MKIAAAKTDSFVKAPDRAAGFVLIYGPDAGLVSERVKIISKTVVEDLSDPFRVVDLPFEKIKDDAALFADEINAISMTGGRRLVRVVTGSAALPKELAAVMENANNDALVVFVAGDLPPSSGLRKFFEKANNAAAVPCYKDDGAAIGQVVRQRLQENGISFDSDVVQYLVSSFSGDRMVILSEVEKFITYLGENKRATLEDVREAVYDSSEFSLDELCMAFASRDPMATERHYNKAISEGVVPVTIIRTILRYFMRLREAQNHIANGANEQQALAALRPPVFFKQVPLFKRHMSIWNSKAINRVIKQFIELEIECKTTGNPGELMCGRLMMLLPLTAVKG